MPTCDTRQVARLSVLEVTSEHKRPLNGDALGFFFQWPVISQDSVSVQAQNTFLFVVVFTYEFK